jgi:purine nucleoside phosphorylase
MKKLRQALLRFVVAVASAVLLATPSQAAETSIPQLRQRGNVMQLVVDGKPFVMLAGELHNSSPSGVEYLQRMWPHLKALGLNAVLAPVSWELTEPAEGRFDFTYVV